jgi:hypothetical protein
VQRRLWPALRRKVGPPRIVQDLSPLLDALSELGRARLLLLTGHRPFGFALGAIPVQLDLLAPNCVLDMDSARPAAMKAVAWPPNGNRRIGHDENRARRAYHGERSHRQRRRGQGLRRRRFRRRSDGVGPLAPPFRANLMPLRIRPNSPVQRQKSPVAGPLFPAAPECGYAHAMMNACSEIEHAQSPSRKERRNADHRRGPGLRRSPF